MQHESRSGTTLRINPCSVLVITNVSASFLQGARNESQLFLYEPILAGQRGSCVEELPLKKPELFDMHDT